MSDKLQVALNEFMFRANSTAKRLRQTAQGCRAQRLPWERTRKCRNPNGVVSLSWVNKLFWLRPQPDQTFLKSVQLFACL